MGFPAHLIYLSNAESICLCSKPKLTSIERFHRRVADPDCGVVNVKMHCNSSAQKYFRLLRSFKVSCGLGLRYSNLVSCGPMKISSVCGNSGVSEVASPQLLSMLWPEAFSSFSFLYFFPLKCSSLSIIFLGKMEI